MKLKIIGWIAFATLALLLVVPFLIPMQTYQSRIEEMASSKLGVPVKIQSLHIALLPSPRVNLGGVVVGDHAEVSVANISAILDVSTVFNKVRRISRLKIDQPVIKQAALKIIQGIKSGDETTVVLKRIEVDGAKLEWPELNLPELDVEVVMSDIGKLEQLTLKSVDGKLNLQTIHKDDGYAAHVSAKKWQLPVSIPVVLDTLEADLTYKDHAVNISRLDAGLYQGKLGIAATLDWHKDWRLQGTFNTKAIELGEPIRSFAKTVTISGLISGDGGFSSHAKEAGQLAESLAIDYKFSVSKGVLHGLDLVKAASLLVKQGQSGGETQFDELSGALKTHGKQVELHQIKVSSGLLKATGDVKVMPDKKLSGLIEAEIKQSVSLVAVPLELSGTTDNPSIKPTKAALVGAVAGTAVLGPAGTALGVKAAGVLDKLFGGGK